jgi:putative ABC transport system permease protein
MSFIDGWRHRIRVWLRSDDYLRELDDEVAHHLALDAASLRGRVGGGSDAERQARRRFGNVTRYKEEHRRAAGLAAFDGLLLDVRHLLRSLRGAPGFALTAILILGLGIGATTAVVSIADHVLLRSLPYRDAGRLVMLLERDQHAGRRTPSAPTAADWRVDPGAAKAFEGVTFIRGDGLELRVGDAAERMGGAFVGPEFFPLLGVTPVLGRTLNADDQRPGAAPVAVLAHSVWQRHYGGDPAIVGRVVTIDSIPTTVVGVLPVGAVYPPFASVWQPIANYRRPEILQRRGFHADSRTIARLRAGVDSTRAMAYMRTVGERLGQEYPAEQAGWLPTMIPLSSEVIGNVRPMLWTLACAAGAVLLLACANVASLLLARMTMRTRELAVRSAMGASRGRVARQLFTESFVLAFIGGTIGSGLALLVVRLSRTLLADRLPRMDELILDWRMLAIAAAATLTTAILCGLWPAFRATRQRSTEVLRASVLGSVGVRAEVRVRRLLVTVQFAVALVLLIGAGLLFESFRKAAAVDVGFDPAGVLTFRVRPPAGVYDTPQQAAALYARLMEATRSVPGVTHSGFINHAPLGSASIYTSLAIEGRQALDSSNQVLYRTVSSSYLATLKLRVATGRWFDDNDIRSPGGSFIVNQTMARLYWGGANPVGQRITVTRASQGRPDFGQPLSGTVVGVVRDVRHSGQDQPPQPEVYVPYTLETWPWGMLVVRTRDGARSIPSLLRAVRSVDARLAVDGAAGEREFGVMASAIDSSLEPRKFSVTLISLFASCALVLAAIGLYGVVAYGVAQRSREIGVRKALGATNGTIVALILRESASVVTVGVVAGALGAWGAARLIRTMLFDTPVVDPATYLATIALLAGVALVAAYLPARRAMRLDPAIAMRGE